MLCISWIIKCVTMLVVVASLNKLMYNIWPVLFKTPDK